ncbi:hypothetical protein GCM10022251_80130 [Phytohabitans flavus]|uniref:Uncharacterized protein n=1 Tax=Phytohabitans flavus TaxID=1076124 RepID=A0A6F8XIS6_9ACTN|nr:hypothetical protein [Phytohabitans flavus]BCB73716.1 hypothetical protein Pflav_001260 [Phytohabitans flavus]
MNGALASGLAPIAEKHDLGGLVSLHRQERPLIRYRARMFWIIGVGLLVGVIWVAFPDPAVFLSVLAVHLVGVALSGPVAAWAFPPDGPSRWVALFERGLVDVTQHDVDHRGREPEHDLVVRVVRFEQIRQVEQHRGYAYSTGQSFQAGSAAARVVADRDGQRTVIDLHGYRHQDKLLDAVRAHVGDRLRAESLADLRSSGQARFGELLVTTERLSVSSGTGGLLPGEASSLSLSNVVRVQEMGKGASLIIYRRSRPGERSIFRDGSNMWFSGAVPNATAAAEAIAAMRGETSSGG